MSALLYDWNHWKGTGMLRIEGSRYRIQREDLAGVLDVRWCFRVTPLRRHGVGEHYHVVCHADGQTECDCADYLFRRRARSACKHIEAVFDTGLTPIATADEVVFEID